MNRKRYRRMMAELVDCPFTIARGAWAGEPCGYRAGERRVDGHVRREHAGQVDELRLKAAGKLSGCAGAPISDLDAFVGLKLGAAALTDLNAKRAAAGLSLLHSSPNGLIIAPSRCAPGGSVSGVVSGRRKP